MSNLPPPDPGDRTGDQGDQAGDADGRRWKTWHLVVAVLVALFVGIGIGVSDQEGTDGDPTAAGEPEPAETVTVTEEAAPEPAETVTVTAEPEGPAADEEPQAEEAAPGGEDVIVQEYSGSGQHQTRPFTVEDGWEIQWTADGDIFQIYLHDESGDLVGIEANQQGSGSGSAYQPRGGTFSLETNAIGNWTIRIVQVAL